jgi:alpha-L-rhamnosidase
MVSFNHYANGAVGDWLYRRIAGIEATSGGYKTFKIAPLPGGGLTSANGEIISPFGRIFSNWKIADGIFNIEIEVPVSTQCQLNMPDGSKYNLASGKYTYKCKI